MMQGATLMAAIVDCLEAGHISKASDMLAAYIGLSRVKTKEALLIAQAFSPGLFCHGPALGPELLMKVLRREITADEADKDCVCSFSYIVFRFVESLLMPAVCCPMLLFVAGCFAP